MDDLKLLGTSEEDLENEIKIVLKNQQRHEYEFGIIKVCQKFFKKG
jgi:hypothetical protein